jgi:hypothetical protein
MELKWDKEWEETKSKAREVINKCIVTGQTDDLNWHHLHYHNKGEEVAWLDIIPLTRSIHEEFHIWQKEDRLHRSYYDIIAFCEAKSYPLSEETKLILALAPQRAKQQKAELEIKRMGSEQFKTHILFLAKIKEAEKVLSECVFTGSKEYKWLKLHKYNHNFQVWKDIIPVNDHLLTEFIDWGKNSYKKRHELLSFVEEKGLVVSDDVRKKLEETKDKLDTFKLENLQRERDFVARCAVISDQVDFSKSQIREMVKYGCPIDSLEAFNHWIETKTKGSVVKRLNGSEVLYREIKYNKGKNTKRFAHKKKFKKDQVKNV